MQGKSQVIFKTFKSRNIQVPQEEYMLPYLV